MGTFASRRVVRELQKASKYPRTSLFDRCSSKLIAIQQDAKPYPRWTGCARCQFYVTYCLGMLTRKWSGHFLLVVSSYQMHLRRAPLYMDAKLQQKLSLGDPRSNWTLYQFCVGQIFLFLSPCSQTGTSFHSRGSSVLTWRCCCEQAACERPFHWLWGPKSLRNYLYYRWVRDSRMDASRSSSRQTYGQWSKAPPCWLQSQILWLCRHLRRIKVLD